MLVLGRNIGDTIVINDDIYITIFETSPVGNKFKVAIDAPKEMPIVRGEVYERTHPRPAVIENDRRHYSRPRKNCATGPKSASR